MSTSTHRLLEYFHSRTNQSLRLLQRLVEFESHSLDKAGVDALAGFLAEQFRARGASVEIMRLADRGNALQVRWNSGRSAAPVMFLGHLDSVWPAGTVAQRPFRIEDGKAYGPGIFDMKGSLLICLLVCEALNRRLAAPERDVVFFFSPDEEIDSSAALPLLDPLARACRAVLCLEPPLPGGRAKTCRKGAGEFKIAVDGVAAHAGIDHERGANAILELCRTVAKLQSLTDYSTGLTVNVGMIRGGSAANVVPASAEAVVDFRFSGMDQGRNLEQYVRFLKPDDPRCRMRITGGIERPPLERTAEVAALYEIALRIAGRLGMNFGEGSSGGSSDGALTAALGIPTLDGLGPDGDGAHAIHEHVVLADLPMRAALLSEMTQSI